MSSSTNERRRRQTCTTCGIPRPKHARWRWCHHCDKPAPFCPICWAHHHHLAVRGRFLELEAGPGRARVLELEAEGSPELVAGVVRALAGVDQAEPITPDLILPPAFCRLGETIKPDKE